MTENSSEHVEPGESGEPLKQQIDRLAKFIMDEVPGEPSQSQGACDTAIRIMRGDLKRRALLRERLKSVLVNIDKALNTDFLSEARPPLVKAKTEVEAIADGEPPLVFAGLDFATGAITPVDVVFSPEDPNLPVGSGMPVLTFVECEVDGKSVNAGKWIDMPGGYRGLRLRVVPGEIKT